MTSTQVKIFRQTLREETRVFRLLPGYFYGSFDISCRYLLVLFASVLQPLAHGCQDTYLLSSVRNSYTNATLDDLREAVTTLEDAGRIARRVFGGTHPLTTGIEGELQ